MKHLLALIAAPALLLAQTQTTPAQFRKVDPHSLLSGYGPRESR